MSKWRKMWQCKVCEAVYKVDKDGKPNKVPDICSKCGARMFNDGGSPLKSKPVIARRKLFKWEVKAYE